MGIEEAKRRAKAALAVLSSKDEPSQEERSKATLEAQRALYYVEKAKKAAQTAEKIIVISKDQKEKLHKLFPELDSKVELLENGYNPDIFYPRENVDREKVLGALTASNTQDGVVPTDYDNMALFVGKFADFKGIDFILEAAKKYEQDAKDAGKKAITVIVGSGDKEAALKAQAKELQLQDVYFVGRQNHEVIGNLQALADVALVPSREEPFGLVVIEATACGNPVIGTNSGGIPDIMNTTGKIIKKDFNPFFDGLDDSVVSPDEGTVGTYTTDLGILIPYATLPETDEKGKPLEDRDTICSSLADAVTSVFDGTRTFDREHIATYTRQNYDQTVINDKLLGYFKEAIARHQDSSNPPAVEQPKLRRQNGPSWDDDL